MKLQYTERSGIDLEKAFVWYERQRRGLGFEFLDCVENAVKITSKTPELYRVQYSVFRGCLIRRFPFSIFYTVEDSEVMIHSVFDTRQDTGKRPE